MKKKAVKAETTKHQEEEKQKFKLKLLPTITAFILIIGVIVFAYFGINDIQSNPTEEIKENCNIQTSKYMGRKVFTITKKEGKISDKVIIYFHGGSYIAQMTEKHWQFIGELAQDTGATIILPDYPLAPKYSYKNVYEMVEPLYKEIIKKVKPEKLIIMGDSAGGGLSLALEEKLGEQNIEMPSQTILISPWVDASMQNSKMEEIQPYDIDLKIETLKLAAIAYAGGQKETTNYLISPINGNLSKLKNITILTGTYDILNPDTYILKEKAKQQGVEINILEYEKAQHIWIIEHNCEEQLVEKGYKDLINLVNNN